MLISKEAAQVLSEEELAAHFKRSKKNFVSDAILSGAPKQEALEHSTFKATSFLTGYDERSAITASGSSAADEDTERGGNLGQDSAIEQEKLRLAREEGMEAGKLLALEQIEAEKEAARQEALSIARWEADKEISGAKDIFVAAAKWLETASVEAEEKLMSSIRDAVHGLASERAGIEIDASPASFVARLQRVARDISSNCNGLTVYLAEEDLSVISPLIEGEQFMIDGKLRSNKALARGDFELTTGDISHSDVLSQSGGKL